MKNIKSYLYKISFWLISSSFFLAIFFTAQSAQAGSAHLTWNANTEPDLDGYFIYYDTSSHAGTCPSGFAHSYEITDESATSHDFTDLTDGETYYFQLTAYDNASPANESDCSDEVSKIIGRGALYRFLNLQTGDHFYTADAIERDWLLNNFSWLWEGEGTAYNTFTSQAENSSPVYRFLNLQNGQHFFTIDASERDWLLNNFSWLWEGEGTAFYAYTNSQPNSTPVYRFLNLQNGQHFFTADVNERDWLLNNFSWLWEGEGTSFYTPNE